MNSNTKCSCDCHIKGKYVCVKCDQQHEIRKKLVIREIVADDIDKKFLETLDSLKPGTSTQVNKNAAKQRCSEILETKRFKVFVALLNSEVVSTVALTLEPKFINNLGTAGHIEDVATREGFEGRGISSMVMMHAFKYAESVGCYKTILNCEEKVIPYYKKIGMKIAENSEGKTEIEMRYDHN